MDSPGPTTLWKNKTFCDIGSGAGRLLLSAATPQPGWKPCRGLEILDGLHNISTLIANRCVADDDLESILIDGDPLNSTYRQRCDILHTWTSSTGTDRVYLRIIHKPLQLSWRYRLLLCFFRLYTPRLGKRTLCRDQTTMQTRDNHNHNQRPTVFEGK